MAKGAFGMIKCTFGIGRNKDDAQLCVKEAVKDFKDPKLIVFFSDEYDFCDYARIIHLLFPKSVSIGCSAYRLWGTYGSEKNVLKVLGIEDGIEVSADVFPKADNFALTYADRVKSCVDNIGDTENTVCVEFTVPYKNYEEYALVALNSVLLRKEIPVIGGTAANDNTTENAYVALNGEIYEDGCVFALIKNLGGKVRLYRENIYVPLTERQFVTTKANSVSRTVMRLGSKTAAEVYASELGISVNEIKKEDFFYHPLGRRVGDETYVTAIYEAGTNGSLKNLARIHEGTDISVMKVGDYKKITEETFAKIKRENPDVSLVILFNCLARTILYEDENAVDDYQRRLVEEFPNSIGFSCCGEQMGTKHFNHTALFLVFE